MAAGDTIIDSGMMVVATGRGARSEAFEVVRRKDGGRTMTSVIRGKDNAYRVEGRWEYDGADHAVSSEGRGSYNSVPTTISIAAKPPAASIRVSNSAGSQSTPAPCNPDCLIDMTPSALPMFNMTRLIAHETGKRSTFRWIGQNLLSDQSLLEGEATIEVLGKAKVNDVEIVQFRFVENLTDAKTGKRSAFTFNLWTDRENRPLAFSMASGTIGAREGFEFVPQAMPGIFQ